MSFHMSFQIMSRNWAGYNSLLRLLAKTTSTACFWRHLCTKTTQKSPAMSLDPSANSWTYSRTYRRSWSKNWQLWSSELFSRATANCPRYRQCSPPPMWMPTWASCWPNSFWTKCPISRRQLLRRQVMEKARGCWNGKFWIFSIWVAFRRSWAI